MEEKRCEFCGTELKNGESQCPGCGSEVFFNEPKRNRNEGTVMRDWKKGGAVATVLICILLIAIRCVVNLKINKLEEDKREQEFQQEMNERYQKEKENKHKKNVAAYLPGYVENGKFISTHFDFQIDLDGKWIEFSQKDLEAYEKTRRKDAIDTDKANIKKEALAQNKGIDEKELEKELKEWEDTYYFEIEHGGTFIKNNEFAGEFTMVAWSVLGIEDVSTNQQVENMKNSFGDDVINLTTGYEKIGEGYYDKIQWESSKNKDVVVTMFIRKKDGIMCQIECRAPKKYSNELVESLLKSISYYGM